ncbi:MAG: prevent-host-death protein [Muribaculaceae bacterium]
MLVISSREFRDNQKKYFDKIDAGEQVVVQRGKNVSYRITPVTKDDTLMTEEEFYAMIERSAQQAREGKVTRIDSIDGFKLLLGL